MRIEFKIGERKENKKSKSIIKIGNAEIRLKGSKDLVTEIYECINKNILNEDRVIY